MLETLMFKQGKKVLGLNAVAFKTSGASATTITTSQLGTGFTTEYSVDGGNFTPTGESFVIPAGEHEVTLSLTVDSGTVLSLLPFKDILTEVTDWEGFQLPNIRFIGCAKLTKVPNRLPVAVTDLSYMFRSCVSFNQDISGWDTSQATDMSYMFHGCTTFNQDIGNWDVSRVTNMTYMFNGCASFNKDISRWIVSQVTSMNSMFQNCTTFNQDVGGWDTSNVTDMYYMFSNCTAFNQDISRWKVSNVTRINYMFRGCTSFNQDLSSMVFKSTVGRTNYDQGTTAWNAAYRPKFTG